MSCQNFEMDSRRTYRFLLWKIWKKLKKNPLIKDSLFLSSFRKWGEMERYRSQQWGVLLRKKQGLVWKEPHHPFSILYLQNPQRSWKDRVGRLRPSALLSTLLNFIDRIFISDLQMGIQKVIFQLFMFSNTIKNVLKVRLWNHFNNIM